jgi:predicted alpha-1,2-mannosidase
MFKLKQFLKVYLLNGILCSTLYFISLNELKAQQLTQFVDPLIGSGGHGHVFVGASVPFGAVQLGPNNIYKGWDWCSGYHYSDSLIIGFSHLHLSGTGIGDLSDVLFMPIAGEVKLNKGQQTFPHNGYLSSYSHKNEVSKPGYYAVKLDNEVSVELTASERVGFHQYHFPKGKEAHIMIDLQEGINDSSTNTFIEQLDDYTLKGYRYSTGWAKDQKVFFAIVSSKPFKDLKIFDGIKKGEGKFMKGTAIKTIIGFNTGDFVQLKVGISPVSSDNALANIHAEIPHWNFNEVVKKADNQWNKELARIEIKTNNIKEKRIFYTSMFHSLIHPSLFNDFNKDYLGSDKKNHSNNEFNNYSIFSTWDTYRAQHPLLNIIAPDRIGDFINSMLAIFDEQKFLPIWHLNANETGTMVGISSIQIIAEAYLKGFKTFDSDRAYRAMKATAMSDIRGLNYIQKFELIPSDVNIRRTVATALELSISDASIAEMAKAMGKMNDYIYFNKRSENYRLYYDSLNGFFRSKESNGSWGKNFDPIKSTKPWAADYAEGNAWQYLWLVPQDIPGLISLVGGKDAFVKKLDTFFSLNEESSEALVDLTGLIGQYAHGNEPSHHIAYLYALADQQWKTAEKVRYIIKEFYHDDPDGVIGNEDCGQMSAWYIFSSIGFYPVFPASQTYVLGSPLFEKATIKLPNNKQFTVIANAVSEENKYIQEAYLNGKKLNKLSFTHNELLNGGTLKLVMGNIPNKN